MARGSDALELLRRDHEQVEQLFRRFERAGDEEGCSRLIEEACAAIAAHADLEEQYFYPVVRDATGCEQLLDEAEIEHASARQLIEELQGGRAEGPRQLALFTVLMEYVRHHVREEEEQLFPLVRRTGMDLEAFGEELAERKGEEPRPGRTAGSGGRRRPGREESAPARAGAGQPRAAAGRAAQLRRGGGNERRAGENGEDDGASHADRSGEDNEAFREAHKDDLSRTTLRAKWIDSADEHEDRPGQSLATRSHEVIRRWAEERRASPATTPGGDAERPHVLRFNFPGYDKNLQEISWEAWFGTFDERDLVFVFQEHMKAGSPSNFFKFDSPEREQE